VKAIVRSIPTNLDVDQKTVTWVEADLMNPSSLIGILSEGDIVINLAYIPDSDKLKNVTLINNIIEVCIRSKVSRLLHCSTAVVVGNTKTDRINELSPCKPSTLYEQTKLALEVCVLSASLRGLDVGILRPTAIVGYGGKNLLKLAYSLKYGNQFSNYFKTCVLGKMPMHLVPIRNVVEALLFLSLLDKQLDGNILKVSLDLDFQLPTSGTHRVICTLVEDSVTGSGPQYYQANYYSGGSSLVDVDGTDWNAKPSNVPDYLMVYRHVARAISPSFLGDPLPSNFYGVGDTETVCFEFTIDPSWDLNKIHIVGMLLDVQGMVDNASSTTIAQAEYDGYSGNCSGSTDVIYLDGPDNLVVYPNPTSNNLYINNMPENTESINIINIEGKTVLNINAKSIIDISKLSKGLYVIKFNGSEFTETRNFVVK